MNTIEQNIPYFNFLVSPVSGEKAEKILEKINEYVIHISKLDSEEWLSLIIKKDTNLFSYKSPFDSINEIGSEVQDESNIHSLENLNTIRKEKDNYFAGSDGILARCNSIVKFIPITYDGTCEITISEDKSTATAKFFPASVKGKQLTENDVIQTIRKMNISVNLELLEINGALEFVKNSNEAFDDVVVARGKEPKLGTDGWTEYLFDTDRKTGPVIDENGNIDFHSLNLIESVSKDQKIGIYHPMVEGEDGYNLFGERLVPPKLKASKLPKGQYIYYAEEEPTHMLSKIDGHISLVRSEVIISNLYNIRGDVDFHTGNVISKGSLNITGNVKSGFNLDMSETIKIGGTTL